MNRSERVHAELEIEREWSEIAKGALKEADEMKKRLLVMKDTRELIGMKKQYVMEKLIAGSLKLALRCAATANEVVDEARERRKVIEQEGD